MKFELEWVTSLQKHLENQILMDNVETCIDTHFLGGHLCCLMVEVCRDRLRIRRKLNPLSIQAEDIALDILVIVFLNF